MSIRWFTIPMVVALALGFGLPSRAETILIVSQQPAGGRDAAMVTFFEGLGYTVDTDGMNNNYKEGATSPWAAGNEAKLAKLQAADLVILSRHTVSGDYDNDRKNWNELATPLLLMSGYLTRNTHWGWTSGASGDALKSVTDMLVVSGQESHPFLDGLTGPVTLFDWSPGTEAPKNVYLPNTDALPVAGATVIGTFDGRTMLMDIPAGTAFNTPATDGTAGARRVFFSTWGYDADP